MKKSFRFKITFVFILITALMILTLCFLNKNFLQKYYLDQKVSELEEVAASVDQLVLDAEKNGKSLSDLFFSGSEKLPGMNGETDSGNYLRDISNKSNIDILLYDSMTGFTVGPSRESEWMLTKLKTYLEFRSILPELPESSYQTIKNTDKYCIQLILDGRSSSQFLECWGTLSDARTCFLLSMPVVSIVESARITNRFLGYVGIIVLIIGSIIIFFVTNTFTKPLNQLAGIAKKMSNLDFSEKYTGKQEDEIGVLGESINLMSEKLETTIDDLRTANEQLREDIDLKERIDELRKEFIANVSHELKTPIALIEGYAEGLSEGIAEDPENRAYYLSVIMDEASKMNKMVSQLTSLQSYEFGKAELVIEEFNLIELIENVLSAESLRLEECGAKIIREYPESCMVLADEFKIEEVVTNYITNAMHHISGEKRLIIRIERIDVKTIRFSVYNDGEPIPEESLPRIWDKFYKVDKARTREYGGSGIGLSIVKAIMEAHHQNYGVKNVENGVEFFITLDSVR